MIFCPKCFEQLPDDSRYCHFCGAVVPPEAPEPAPVVRKPVPWDKLLAVYVVLLLIAAMGTALYVRHDYNRSVTAAVASLEDGTYTNTQLRYPKLAEDLHPDLLPCLEAMELINRGEYSNGYTKLQNLVRNRNPYAEAALPHATAMVYDHAVQLQQDGETGDALHLFTLLKNYEDSDAYRVMCMAILNRWSESDRQDIIRYTSFADMKEIILSYERIAFSFLHGYWQTADGKRYFSVNDVYNFYLYHNLPEPFVPANHHYELNNGLYRLYHNDTHQLRSDVFRFTIVDQNTIEIYCYQNKTTYTMYRQ